jgi:GNAT superfamily N-acetyltransferase
LTDIAWRGPIGDDEVEALHAEAFDHDPVDHDWSAQLSHCLGWVTARRDDALVGFVTVAWDGGGHAWIVDTMVAGSERGQGVGRAVVDEAVANARAAGCEWLHVDFDEDLRDFYLACGFEPAEAGLIRL